MIDSLVEFVADWVRTAPGLTMIWIAAVGACVGSFLNVVIYRLPAGMSLVYPGSRCPQCGHAIRGYDNVPVLSWCLLRGRCRDCHAPIAGRYPLVEATVALLFALQWWVDLQLGSSVTASDTLVFMEMTAFLLHASLFCCLLAGALMDADGQPIPWSLGWPLVVLVGLFAWRQPAVIARLHDSSSVAASFQMGQVLAGGLFAAFVAIACRGSRPWTEPWSTPVVLGASCGLVLGGSTAGLLIILATIGWLGLSRAIPGITAPILLTTLVGIDQLMPGVFGFIELSGVPTWLAWGLFGLTALGLGYWARRSSNIARSVGEVERRR